LGFWLDAMVTSVMGELRLLNDWTLVMQTYRARALQRMGRAPAARQVLDDVVKLAARLDDEGDLLVSARYLRSRAAILNGRVAQAMDDLHAIEAVESDSSTSKTC